MSIISLKKILKNNITKSRETARIKTILAIRTAFLPSPALLMTASLPYNTFTRFLYSANAASKRSRAVVSPGTLCEGWM